MGTLTDSEILLQLNYCSRAFRWNVSQYFWVIRAFESQKDTTWLGQIPGNAKLKRT